MMNKNYLAGAVLCITIMGGELLSNQHAQAVSLDVCKAFINIMKCEEPNTSPELLHLASWGNVGAVVYPSAASAQATRNPVFNQLNDDQKYFLRPYFGNLVDEVRIHYNALLTTQIGAPSSQFKISFDSTEGQAFGYDIYISQPFEPTYRQLSLLSHEIFHTLQMKELNNSLVEFGRRYFAGYSSAGQSYENNPFEVEATNFQINFSQDQVTAAINACAAQSFSGICSPSTIQGIRQGFGPISLIPSSIPTISDYRTFLPSSVISFAFTDFLPVASPGPSGSSNFSLTETEQAEFIVALDTLREKSSESVPEPSTNLGLFGMTLGLFPLANLRKLRLKSFRST